MKQNIKKIMIFLLAIFLIIPSVSQASEYETTLNIPVEVTVDGDTPEEEYTFSLEAKENALNHQPDQSEIKVAKNSKGEFGPITYDTPGKYSYVVKQIAGENINTTYDQSYYDVDVYVINEQDENGAYTGRLISVLVAYKDGAEEKSDKIIFENLFKLPKAVEHDPPIKKTIIGDKPNEKSQFTFRMTAISTTAAGVTEMPLPEGGANGIKEVIHEGEGEFEFGIISFAEPGTYIYEMIEVNTNVENYIYDDSKYVVEYVVTQEGDQLFVDRTITKNGEEVEEVEFVNEYQAPDEPQPPTEPEKPEPKPQPQAPKEHVAADDKVQTGDLGVSFSILLVAIATFLLFVLSRNKKAMTN